MGFSDTDMMFNEPNDSQSNAQSERNKLIEELSELDINYKDHQKNGNDMFQKLLACEVEQIANFILKDRERICEPLVKVEKEIRNLNPDCSETQMLVNMCKMCNISIKSIRETLQRAGIE